MNKYKKITNDQWEGLQFELSELKSQMTQVMDLLGIEATETLEESGATPPEPETYLYGIWKDGTEWSIPMSSRVKWDSPMRLDDWGMDTKWQEREPQLVTPAGAPDGLELGPFVLTTPEERAAILRNWDKKKKELKGKETQQEYLVKEIRELKAELVEVRQMYADLLRDLKDADRNAELLVDEIESNTRSYDKLNAMLIQAQGELAYLKNQPRNSPSEWGRMVEEGPA